MADSPLIQEFKELSQILLSPKLCADLECELVAIEIKSLSDKETKQFILGQGSKKYFWFPKLQFAVSYPQMIMLLKVMYRQAHEGSERPSSADDTNAPVA